MFLVPKMGHEPAGVQLLQIGLGIGGALIAFCCCCCFCKWFCADDKKRCGFSDLINLLTRSISVIAGRLFLNHNLNLFKMAAASIIPKSILVMSSNRQAAVSKSSHLPSVLPNQSKHQVFNRSPRLAMFTKRSSKKVFKRRWEAFSLNPQGTLSILLLTTM